MTDTEQEIRATRDRLRKLAEVPDRQLDRYHIEMPPIPPGIYWKVRWLTGWGLRKLEMLGLRRPDPWPARLKRSRGNGRAMPLLIWAVGMQRESIREACNAYRAQQDLEAEFAPVLVTDVADFAYYSRLGWLVEYLPAIDGEGETYARRKAKFLARTYRDAPALPADAILETDWPRLRILILQDLTRSNSRRQ